MKRHPLLLIVFAVLAASCTGGGDSTTTLADPPAPTAPSTTGATTTTSPPEPATAAVFEDAPCRFAEPQGFPVRCGDLIVDENRDAPGGSEVRLHVAVFESGAATPAADPVVYLEGGPGGHVLEALQFVFADRFAPVLETRDLIIFDQRGAGLSEPSLACPEVLDAERDLLDEPDAADAEDRLTTALIECRDRIIDDGADLTAYHSAENAADVADLRVALGYDEVNLWGISYGTRLALTTMRDHPEGIRSVILDSTVPPQLDLIASVPASADRSLSLLFGGCIRSPQCAAAYPNLEDRFDELGEALERNPAQVEIQDFLTGDEYDTEIDDADLVSLLFQALYAEDIIPLLPDIITDAHGGDYAGLERLASVMLTNESFFSLGMHLSVQCHEEYVFSTPDDVLTEAEAHPDVADMFSDIVGEFDDCALWGAGTAGAIETQPVSSEIPTLVLAGEYDPITPPQYGRDAAATLPNSFFVEFPGLAHGVSTATECSTGIFMAFLDDPSTQPDAACAGSLPGPEFFVAGEVAVTLVDFEVDVLGTTIRGVHPDDWTDQGFGAFIAPGFGDVGIVYQALPGGLVTIDSVADLYREQLGVEDAWEVSSYDDGERTWTVFHAVDDGLDLNLGAVESNGSVLLVLLIATPEDRDVYLDQVFEPALAAARIVST